MSQLRSLDPLELAAVGARSLWRYKLRSLLTMLGIIFGIASVICMLSISEVARRDVIGRIERLGLRNVIVDSVKPEKLRDQERSARHSYFARYGLTRADIEILEGTLGMAHGSAERTRPGERRVAIIRYGPKWGSDRYGYQPSPELLARLTPERREIVQPLPPRMPPGVQGAGRVRR